MRGRHGSSVVAVVRAGSAGRAGVDVSRGGGSRQWVAVGERWRWFCTVKKRRG